MKGGNDNPAPGAHTMWGSPDPHGQAAMLLVESLLHGLIARSIISVADAVEMVDVASDVKADIGPELGDTPAALRKSLSLLAAVAASLRADISED